MAPQVGGHRLGPPPPAGAARSSSCASTAASAGQRGGRVLAALRQAGQFAGQLGQAGLERFALLHQLEHLILERGRPGLEAVDVGGEGLQLPRRADLTAVEAPVDRRGPLLGRGQLGFQRRLAPGDLVPVGGRPRPRPTCSPRRSRSMAASSARSGRWDRRWRCWSMAVSTSWRARRASSGAITGGALTRGRSWRWRAVTRRRVAVVGGLPALAGWCPGWRARARVSVGRSCPASCWRVGVGLVLG